MDSKLLFDTGAIQLLRLGPDRPLTRQGNWYRLVLPYPFCEIPPTNEVTAAWADISSLQLGELLGQLSLAVLEEIRSDNALRDRS